MGNPNDVHIGAPSGPAPYPAGQPMHPPPGYDNSTGYQQTVTVVQPGYTAGTTVVFTGVNAVAVSPNPVQIECPNCHTNVVTQIEYESGTLTWLLVGGLVLVGCWLGCCLIPTCVDGCKDVLHSCPNCKVFLGRHRKL